MNKQNCIIILGTAHLSTTPGKCSPDGRLKESVWSRETCKELCSRLRENGYNAVIDYEPLEPSAEMKGANAKQEQSKELIYRAGFVNNLCKRYGKQNCIYISIHVNAAGADGKWHSAGGFSVYTSHGQTKSDILAEYIYDKAFDELASYTLLMNKGKQSGLYDSKQKPFRMDTSDGDKDMEADFYVLRKTNCPAILVECMFQDNKSDVDYLLSDEGRSAIIRTIFKGITSYIVEN